VGSNPTEGVADTGTVRPERLTVPGFFLDRAPYMGYTFNGWRGHLCYEERRCFYSAFFVWDLVIQAV
jgi:hypothetical protein